MIKSLLKNTTRIALTGLILTSSTQCLAYYGDAPTPLNVDLGYIQPKNLPHSNKTINKIRLEALKETATGLGAKGGLAWRSNIINKTLIKDQSHLDSIFNFNQLLLQHNVLPPVLVESSNNLNLDNDKAIRLNSKTYRIIKQARFVTAPPTWRTYLTMNYLPPSVPDSTLLPKTKEEASAWNEFLTQGWEQGISQANDIFRSNLDRLQRDVLGMILYKKLLAQHMVSAPFVANTNLGVTGDKDEMHINDQVLRITSESKLMTDSSKWTPVFSY